MAARVLVHPLPTVLMQKVPQEAYAPLRGSCRALRDAGGGRSVVLYVALCDVRRARDAFPAATGAVVECDGREPVCSLEALDGLREATIRLTGARALACGAPRVHVFRVVGPLVGTLEVPETVRELHLPRWFDARGLLAPHGLRVLSAPAARNVHDQTAFRALASLDVSHVRPFPTLDLPLLRALVAQGTYMPRGTLRLLPALETLDARGALRLDLCTAAGMPRLVVDARGAALPWEERDSVKSALARFSLAGAFWRVGPVVRYEFDSAWLVTA
jgi:hypothetical protein